MRRQDVSHAVALLRHAWPVNPMMRIADTVEPLREPSLRDVHDAWMLAIGVSLFPCIMVATVASSCAEAVVALADARFVERGVKRPPASQMVRASTKPMCVAERLAFDRRGTECQAFGEAMSRITTPLMKELILVSSVIC